VIFVGAEKDDRQAKVDLKGRIVSVMEVGPQVKSLPLRLKALSVFFR
jgi:hypothetical protein